MMKLNRAALLATGLILLAGCGAETKTGSTGTGRAPDSPELSMASGPLNGLGPLDVAGATLDESGIAVLLNSSLRSGAQDLRLGMTSNTNGSASLVSGTGRASAAVAQSMVVAPAQNIDVATNTFGVLALRFKTDGNTLFEGIAGLAQMVPGDQVEVFGLQQVLTPEVLATRVIVRRDGDPTRVELLGPISQIAAAGLTVQGISVNTTGAQFSSPGPAGLVASGAGLASLGAGSLARITGRLNLTTGAIDATAITTGLAPARNEGNVIFIEGFVRTRVGSTRLTLEDLEIDTTSVPLFPASAEVGARLRVRGIMRGGLMRAEAIEVLQPQSVLTFTIEGTVSDYTTLSSFVVRGERVDASQATFVASTASNLANGRLVRLKGVASGGKLNATLIQVLN